MPTLSDGSIPAYECMNCGTLRTSEPGVWISCEDELGRSCRRSSEGCQTFTPADGAAWPWCDTCGTRADVHPGEAGGYRRAVERIIARTYA